MQKGTQIGCPFCVFKYKDKKITPPVKGGVKVEYSKVQIHLTALFCPLMI